MEKRPNLFIIGFPKTGTSALFEMLGRHPDIYPSILKEPGSERHFKYFHPECSQEHRQYMDNFKNVAGERWIMDGTVGYSLNIASAAEIKAFSPSARIVVGLRDPLDCVASSCHQIEKNTGRKIDLKAAIRSGEKFTLPRFFPVCKRYFEVFGAPSIHVYQFSDFQASNTRVVRDICGFLGLPSVRVKEEVKNVSVQPRSGSLGSVYAELMGAEWAVDLRQTWKRQSRYTYNFASDLARRLLTKRASHLSTIRNDPSLVTIIRERWHDDVQQLSTLLDVDLLKTWGFR